MRYFPLFVDTRKLRVLVVGAGEVASRKLALLTRTHADIRVIAPEATGEVLRLAEAGRISLERRTIQDADVQDLDLIYLATFDDALNAHLATLATERGIWANAVDNPQYCRFITPSIVERGRLLVAVSTAGAAPVFARSIRARLETWLPQSLTPLLDFVAARRQEVQQRLASTPERRQFWERFFSLNGERFDNATEQHYQHAFQSLKGTGEIFLLDHETQAQLLPLAAVVLLQRLDAVYTAVDLPLDLNELLRRDAERASLPSLSELSRDYEQGRHVLVYADKAEIARLKAHFPVARHLRPGAL